MYTVLPSVFQLNDEENKQRNEKVKPDFGCNFNKADNSHDLDFGGT